MTKKYKDMNLSELILERQRLKYYIEKYKGKNANKQNIKSLRRVEELIWKIRLN